jgi:hypothetical protein
VNPAGLRLWAASGADQVVGQPAMAFIHPEDRDRFRARATTAAPAPQREAKFVRLDGEEAVENIKIAIREWLQVEAQEAGVATSAMVARLLLPWIRQRN